MDFPSVLPDREGGIAIVKPFDEKKNDDHVWRYCELLNDKLLTLTLAEVYASRERGRITHLDGPGQAAWYLRLFRDSGALRFKKQHLRLPESLSKPAVCAAHAFAEAQSLQGGGPIEFSMRFVPEYVDELGPWAARSAIGELVEAGVLASGSTKAGKKRGYRPNALYVFADGS